MMVVYAIAVIFVFFEEWLVGWLKIFAARLAKLPAIARLEAWVITLNAFSTVLLLAALELTLVPLKILILWFLAHNMWIFASLFFILAKVLGMTIFARVFVLKKPMLLNMKWFAWCYNHWARFSAWAHEKVKSSHVWQRLLEIKAAVKVWMANHRPGPWFRRFRAAFRAARRPR